MAIVKMSESALNELKELLKNSDIDTDIVRIIVSGMGCSGPRFGITLDEQKEDDLVEKIEDLTFLVQKDINEEFGALQIKSSEENGYGGLSIETEIPPAGGCSTCSGCH
ncbi:HesB-like protein [Hathewaya histolytica]|uniref:HesB family protein n=1 Tax=Hathewaya histolytica TaxID=1498 RepID=A0A4U9RRL5_HATHI|nr:HesB-like protein [Hathewaya histolytica]VTQ94348.1 HesB family protein [Hathewaya histolytica]